MQALLTSPLVAQSAGLATGLVLALMLYRLGGGAFRAGLFRDALATGAIMGATILFVEAPFDLRHNALKFSDGAIAFGFAGFPEEAAKLMAVQFFIRRHYLRRSVRDLALGAGAVALGFAILENMLYISGAGAAWGSIALARATTAVPFHVLLGIAGSLAFRLRARPDDAAAVARICAVWIVLACLHGGYDYAIMNLRDGVALPHWIQALDGYLGLSARNVLPLLAMAAMLATTALAWIALRRSAAPKGPNGARPGWLGRLALSRALGHGVAALILAPVLVLAIFGAVFRSMLTLSGAAGFLIASLTLPVAIALLIGRDATPFLPHRFGRRAHVAILATLTLLGAAALGAAGWGMSTVRDAVALSFAAQGEQFAQSGDLRNAALQFDQAVAISPNQATIRLGRAGVRLQLKAFADALEDANRAMTLNPRDAAPLLMRGEIAYAQHDLATDRDFIDKALALAPANADILAQRCNIDRELGDLAALQADVRRAAQLAPTHPRVLEVEALAAEALGDLKSAQTYYTLAIAMDSNRESTVFGRGRIEYFLGDMKGAAADFRRSAQIRRDIYPNLWLFLADAREGRDGAAELAAGQTRVHDTNWPFPIVRYFEGEIDAEAMRAAASGDDDRCEADFYAGELMAARGDIAGGRSRLAAAKDECPGYYVEKPSAEIEWKRLTADRAAAPPEPSPAAAPAPAAGARPVQGVTRAALLVAGGQRIANVAWRYLDDGAGEVRADMVFDTPHVQFQLRLMRIPRTTGPAYVLRLVAPADEFLYPPLSVVVDGLGTPVLYRGRSNGVMPALDTFHRVGPGAYEMSIPPEYMTSVLTDLSHATFLQIPLEFANRNPLRLGIELTPSSAAVWRAAQSDWGL